MSSRPDGDLENRGLRGVQKFAYTVLQPEYMAGLPSKSFVFEVLSTVKLAFKLHISCC